MSTDEETEPNQTTSDCSLSRMCSSYLFSLSEEHHDAHSLSFLMLSCSHFINLPLFLFTSFTTSRSQPAYTLTHSAQSDKMTNKQSYICNNLCSVRKKHTNHLSHFKTQCVCVNPDLTEVKPVISCPSLHLLPELPSVYSVTLCKR